MVSVTDWFRGKHVLIVEDNYIAASRLETRLLHFGALVVGPAASVGDALSLIVSENVDAAVLDVDLSAETSLPIAEILTRRGTPFVFLSQPPTNWIPRRYQDLVLSKPPELAAIAHALAENAEARQNNVVPFCKKMDRDTGQ